MRLYIVVDSYHIDECVISSMYTWYNTLNTTKVLLLGILYAENQGLIKLVLVKTTNAITERALQPQIFRQQGIKENAT